jgi:type II secretory pathway pseudopilin PulG
MIGLMAAIAIMLILSTIAVQEWKEVVRRDNEAEMMFRAEEIVRAIRKYQKDRGALPTELKQLIEPGSKGQYFLRRLYKDPLVKGGAWGLLYSGPQGALVDPSAPPPETGAAPTASGIGIRPLGTTPTPPTPLSQIGQTGEVAGLPIAGVKTLCKDRPFRVYQDQTEYANWLFSIFDLEGEAGGTAPPPTGGQPPPAPGQPAPPPGQ